MTVRFLGESCIIIRDLPLESAEFAHIIGHNPFPGILEVVPAFHQVALYFNPEITDYKKLLPHVKALVKNSNKIWKEQLGTDSQPVLNENQKELPSNLLFDSKLTKTHHVIPAHYDAPDLHESAEKLRLTLEQFIKVHSQTIYVVEAIGFCPGFPYLAGLPPELQNLPRRSAPRTSVEPGTIAITGDQCCIYPLERPGGWNLIARTPLVLVDPENDFFPLQVGDTLQFEPITQQEFDQIVGKRL